MGVEFLHRPDRGKGAYRLKCRFVIDASPTSMWGRAIWATELNRMKIEVAERFVEDMAKQGFEYLDKYGIQMFGPFPTTPEPIGLKRPRRLTAAEMLPGVMAGNRFRANGESMATLVLPLAENETWEYELRAVFVHPTLVIEYPYPHEEGGSF